MDIEYAYVDTVDLLKDACKKIVEHNIIGVDIECENNLHHYGTHLSLIQVTSGDKHWILDALVVEDMRPFLDILQNKSIQKIFHDVDFDFRMLERTYGCRPKNVFDTQLAALLIGKKDIGLGTLLEEYFHIKKERKYQMADWLKRPISSDMLQYATKDTVYLVRLRGVLIKELKQLDRLHWCEQECRHLEERDFLYHEQDALDVKGVKSIKPVERAIFKRMFDVREQLAKKVDRPVHFIISTKRLRDFASHPPTLAQWQKMQQVHPVLRAHAHLFHNAVQQGKQEQLEFDMPARKRFSQKQKQIIEQLTALRDAVAQQKGIQAHIIANKDQIRDVAICGNYHSFRPWQRELLGQKI